MAKLIGRAAGFGRVLLTMEGVLVCLLLALSMIGNATGLDRTMRKTATGVIAGLYDTGEPAARGVPIPKTAVARVPAPQPFTGVQAQAGRTQ